MKKLLLLAAGLVLAAPAVTAQSTTAAPAEAAAPKPTHVKAAAELLDALQMEQTLSNSINQMMEMQLRQRPELKSVEGEMRTFFTRYMGWGAIKDDMALIYAREMSEKELRDLTKFMRTPSGQKFVARQPQLMMAGMELGQRKVEDHLPELQKTIMEKMQGSGTD